jgi:hypothetical protein
MEASESSIITRRETGVIDNFRNIEAYASGVSWSAVIAGAFVTAALWLILLALGAGIGLSAISPWSNTGAAPATVGKIGIIWLIADNCSNYCFRHGRVSGRTSAHEMGHHPHR